MQQLEASALIFSVFLSVEPPRKEARSLIRPKFQGGKFLNLVLRPCLPIVADSNKGRCIFHVTVDKIDSLGLL